ncbi:MAG: hypothetical protein DRJ28_06875 [Actinobacteria bacterium]|nr:MAG: hypothetical protein DRJ28_06875 [Actinomycetota bacterium]
MPGWPLCVLCVASLRLAPPAVVRGVSVEAGFRHVGAAVRLVHNLKYRRSIRAGRILAAAMVSGLPADATVLVPVPRSLVRRVTYGIDQAKVLAKEVSILTGLEVLDALGAPIWWKRQAGATLEDRHAISFRRIGRVPEGAILVDDVFTTGTTAMSAIDAAVAREMSILVATSAGTMEPGTKPFPSLGGDVTQLRGTIETWSHAARTRSQSESADERTVVRPRLLRATDREEIG